MIKQINLSDVKAFNKALIMDGTSFHPDDDFRDYLIKDSSKPAYSLQEAELRNGLMETCFAVCSNARVDIYDVMLEVFLKETGMDKHIPLHSNSINTNNEYSSN